MNRKLKITAALLLSSGSVVVSRATNWRQASGPASMASSSIDSRQKGGSRMRLAHLRLLFVTAALGVAALAILVSGPGASGVRQSQAKLSPQAALDWNLIAVNTVRSATLTPTKFQPEGTLYMAYVQAAEYNAVMAISGRYAPYRSSLQAIPGASPRAAVAAAAYTTLSYYFPTLAPSLVTAYNDYLNVTLAQVPEKARLAGVAVGSAAASQLIVSRFGDGRDAPVSTAFGVAPQAPGTWVFAPPPSATVGPDPVAGEHEAVHARHTRPVPCSRSAGDHQCRIRHGPERDREDGLGHEHRPHRGADRDGAVLERQRDQPVQPGLPRRRDESQLRPRRHGQADGDGEHGRGRRRHGLHGLQVPLPVLASDHRHPRRWAGRQCRHDG